MRGEDRNQSMMFSYLSPEARVPLEHPLRRLWTISQRVLEKLSPEFDKLYSDLGRQSIPPERLLRALLLQTLYTVRSERLLIEQLDYNLLFRWFVGLNMDEAVWNATVYSKNRERLLKGDIAVKFFTAVLDEAREANLLSDEHFTVDGTLIEAWASMKSYQPRSEPPEKGSGSRGEMLRSDTHESSTDPEAQLFKKGPQGVSKLSYMAHVVSENRNTLVMAASVTQANSKKEREAAVKMVRELFPNNKKRRTLGADKAYDDPGMVAELRTLNITGHVAQYTGQRGSSIDRRTTRHLGYAVSQSKRKLVEQIFGWLKTIGLLRRTRHRGRALVEWMFQFTMAAYNLLRISKLIPAA
jgi:transposase